VGMIIEFVKCCSPQIFDLINVRIEKLFVVAKFYWQLEIKNSHPQRAMRTEIKKKVSSFQLHIMKNR
jgi:hypothetical protein